MDHEKLAEARIRELTAAADLSRFMVTCALVPNLYCPVVFKSLGKRNDHLSSDCHLIPERE